MRAARALRRELDHWTAAWQQVEAYVDRIEGARDADDPNRRRTDALLRAVAVAERRQSAGTELSEPVVDTLPGRYVPAGETEPQSAAAPVVWGTELRAARVPGSDELELAVGFLAVVDGEVLEPVLVPLPPDRALFDRRDGPLRVLSYPAAGPDAPSIVGPVVLLPEISAKLKGADDQGSLFSPERRRAATLGAALVPVLPGAGQPPDVEPEQAVGAWSATCAQRRVARLGADVPRTLPPGGPAPAVPAAGLPASATTIVSGLRTGLLSGATAQAPLAELAAAARAAAAATGPDAAVLAAAADVLDAEGGVDDALPGRLRTAAAALDGTPYADLAAAADALRETPTVAAARTALEAAAQAVAELPVPDLLLLPPELGGLRADLDDAVAARIGYPDGTLRTLRVLEAGLAARWAGWLRWLTDRYAGRLLPLATRFRAPFVAGVRALVNGGATGLAVQGLQVRDDVPVGAASVVTAQPASLLDALDAVEPGQVGIVGGPRPAALVLLGLDTVGGQLALGVSPLRVSTASGSPGRPGLLAGGGAVGTVAAGLTDTELRSGEAAAGPAADGPVAEAVASWSRLCLVHGRAVVDAEVRGPAGARTVPEPAAVPLESLALHGAVPAAVTAVVLAGLPDAFWDRSDGDPQPRVVRPGETLLIRGRGDRTTPGPARSCRRRSRSTGWCGPPARPWPGWISARPRSSRRRPPPRPRTACADRRRTSPCCCCAGPGWIGRWSAR